METQQKTGGHVERHVDRHAERHIERHAERANTALRCLSLENPLRCAGDLSVAIIIDSKLYQALLHCRCRLETVWLLHIGHHHGKSNILCYILKQCFKYPGQLCLSSGCNTRPWPVKRRGVEVEPVGVARTSLPCHFHIGVSSQDCRQRAGDAQERLPTERMECPGLQYCDDWSGQLSTFSFQILAVWREGPASLQSSSSTQAYIWAAQPPGLL